MTNHSREAAPPSLYQNHFLKIEGIIAAGVAILLVVILPGSQLADHEFERLLDARQAFYSAIIGAAGSLLGFVLATTAVLMSFMDKPVFNTFKAGHGHVQLWHIVRASTSSLGVTTLAGISALIIDTPNHPHVWLFQILFTLSSISLVHCGRVVWAMNMVVQAHLGR